MFPPEPPASESPTPAPGPTGRPGCDILLVDDTAIVRDMLALSLRRAGYTLQVAGDGRSALRLLEQYDFRLLVTDIYMPETDGLELISRCLERSPTTPIIAMSGGTEYDSELMLRMSKLLGAHHILAKPFQVEEFLALVKRALA